MMFVLLLISACGGPSTCAYRGAGLLVVSNQVALLGQRCAEGTWTDFGGGVDPKDRCDVRATALREFTEETRGLFDVESVKEALRQPPATGSSWVVSGPKDATLPDRFARSYGKSGCNDALAGSELRALQWVPFSQVDALDLDPGFRDRWQRLRTIDPPSSIR